MTFLFWFAFLLLVCAVPPAAAALMAVWCAALHATLLTPAPVSGLFRMDGLRLRPRGGWGR